MKFYKFSTNDLGMYTFVRETYRQTYVFVNNWFNNLNDNTV